MMSVIERFLPIAKVLPKPAHGEEIFTQKPINGITGLLPFFARGAVLTMDDKFL
jgi:hypothetical protein